MGQLDKDETTLETNEIGRKIWNPALTTRVWRDEKKKTQTLVRNPASDTEKMAHRFDDDLQT